MGLPLGARLRYALASALLRLSDAATRLLLRVPKSRAPGGSASLPGDDPDPVGRQRGLDRAQAEYALVPLSVRFPVRCAPRHRTAMRLPVSERYPPSMLASKAPLLAALRVDLTCPERVASVAELDRLQGILPRPAAADWWDDDAAFARQRIAGPNPVFLERTDPDVLGSGVRATLRPDRPAYVVDHRVLLRGVTAVPGTFLHPVMAVFQEDGSLVPRCIAIEREGKALFVTPRDGDGWRLARMFFQSADFWVHEIVVHYLWTHVIGEKLVLATRRHLSERHPLHRLLGPHFANTLQMNRNGVKRLVVEGGLFDRKFAGGPAGKAAAIAWGVDHWHFGRMVHPTVIAQRGLDRLAEHPYRDDGKLVWDALLDHARAYVALYYADDAAVKADPELLAWGAELFDDMGDRGFPRPADRETLVLVLTATLFNVVQHDLVNALQYDTFGYPPNAPSMMRVPMPADPRQVRPEDLVAALPEWGTCMAAAIATYGFSRRYEPLGNGVSRWFEPRAQPLAEALAARLAAVDATLAERDGARSVPYRIAAPATLGNSISA